ncbi:MAG: nucleotidyltransferase family protein [Chitinophagaceae bacterium]
MIREAIILAGGLGTRLRDAVPDLPKCMAPVLAKPFIGYVIDSLLEKGIEHFICCLGYKHAIIKQYLNTQYGSLSITYSIEEEPLGTGGAIQLACGLTKVKSVLVVNGDTFFNADIKQMSAFHDHHRSLCTLALKPMQHFDRYGAVQLHIDNSLEGFEEKRYQESGLINGGVYVLQVAAFLLEQMPLKFSFENDYLEKNVKFGRFYGFVQDKYFIDIGIPEDYEKAQTELIQNIKPNA